MSENERAGLIVEIQALLRKVVPGGMHLTSLERLTVPQLRELRMVIQADVEERERARRPPV